MSTPLPRDRVFVSYSHKDAEWLVHLKKALAPDIRNQRIHYFDDRGIGSGEPWFGTIMEAIHRARAVVLLVSPNFFASDFIRTEELPRILAAADACELTILWVPLSGPFSGPDAHPDAAKLSPRQAVCDPGRPLASLTEEERTGHMIRLAREIGKVLNPGRTPQNLPFRSLGDLFVGRERELAELDRSPSRVLIGLGGVGKTRLAVEYAWRHSDRFNAFLFARAGTEQELKSGLASLCRPDALDLAAYIAGKEDDQYAAVVRWLQENRDWLLILDNADTPEAVRAVEGLISRLPGGKVVITSRIAEWSRSAPQTRVDVLEPAAARELLVRRSGADTQADALAEKLGRLPLALEIAAAYIAQQPGGFGIAGYLRLYEKSEFDLLNVPPVEAYPKSVYVTWRASVEQLQPGARRMLELHSFLAPTPCPLAMYIRGAEAIESGAGEFQVRAWVRDLFRYSLAEGSGQGETFTVHSLLQAVERHELKASGEEVSTLEAVQGVFVAYADEPSWEPESRALWDVLMPHAEALRGHLGARGMDGRTEVLWRMGNAYWRRGDYRNAVPIYRECLEIEERVLGTEHPATLSSVNNLAFLLKSKGDYTAAEPLYRRALEANERVLGTEHPDTLASVNNLAALLHSKGDNFAAEPLYRRALEAHERVLGPEHPATLTSINNLAELFREKGDYAATEPLLRRALETSERVLGPEHPNTLTSVNNLALLIDSQGESAAAERLHRRALEAREHVLGQEHPDTLRSVSNLAALLLEKGDYAATEPLLRRALEAFERVLGPEHPDTLTSINDLALLLYSQRDYSGAEPLLRRAIEGVRKVLGPDHPETKLFEDNLARCLAAREGDGQAEPPAPPIS